MPRRARKFPNPLTCLVRTSQEGRDIDLEIAQRATEAGAWMGYASMGTLTGTHPETVRRYLRGNTRIPVQFVARLSECLGLPLEWLIFGDAPPPRIDPAPRAPSRKRRTRRRPARQRRKRAKRLEPSTLSVEG